MKYIIFSDIHLDTYNNRFNDKRLENGFEVLVWVFTEAKRRKADAVLFAGDLFDKFGRTSAKVLVETRHGIEFLQRKFEVPIIGASGNHDFYEPSRSLINFIPKRISLGTELVKSIDYEPDKGVLKKMVEGIKEKNQTILLIHQTPPTLGFESCFDSFDLFKGFKHVFCGHIHTPKKLTDTFTLVGNAMPLDYSDEGKDTGIWFYDSDTGELEFIKNEFSPKFEKPKIEVYTEVEETENTQTLSYDFDDALTHYVEQVAQDNKQNLIKTGKEFLK